MSRKIIITDFYCNRYYDKYSIDRNTEIKKFLKEQNINVSSFNGSLLIEPWQCKKDNGNYYKVYTPFYKELIRITKYQPNLKKAVFNKLIKLASSNTLDSLKLLEPKLTWQNIIKEWQVGEQAAAQLT